MCIFVLFLSFFVFVIDVSAEKYKWSRIYLVIYFEEDIFDISRDVFIILPPFFAYVMTMDATKTRTSTVIKIVFLDTFVYLLF